MSAYYYCYFKPTYVDENLHHKSHWRMAFYEPGFNEDVDLHWKLLKIVLYEAPIDKRLLKDYFFNEKSVTEFRGFKTLEEMIANYFELLL
jgi:hypothetical protein